MTAEHQRGQDARIDQAVAELQGMIRRRYPTATFEVAPGEDPEGTYVWTTVDIEDTDQVLDVVIDRLLQLQVEQRLPVHVIPIRTPEQILTTMRAQSPSRRAYPRRPVPSLERARTVSE
jgi:hypothetical protein